MLLSMNVSLTTPVSRVLLLQEYLAHKKLPPNLGPPLESRHRPTVGS